MWEFNKIAGAVLLLALTIASLNMAGDLIYPSHSSGDAASQQATNQSATQANGEAPAITKKALTRKAPRVAASCQPCHTFTQGGKNKVGPNLWQIVGRAKAGHSGFKYSKALQNLGGSWDAASLDEFLANPSKYAKGTKMAFAGIKDATKRAELIKWLATLKPSATQPVSAKPPASKPDAPKPTATKPDAPKPDAKDKPAPKKPATKKPPTPKPIATKKPVRPTATITITPALPKPAAETP